MRRDKCARSRFETHTRTERGYRIHRDYRFSSKFVEPQRIGVPLARLEKLDRVRSKAEKFEFPAINGGWTSRRGWPEAARKLSLSLSSIPQRYISAVYRYPGTGDLTQFIRGILIESERHRACESDFTEAGSRAPHLHTGRLD